jgi:TPR repeat protein
MSRVEVDAMAAERVMDRHKRARAMYYYGQGVEPDYLEAYVWFYVCGERATDQPCST